ncbi:MAG: hypothetical protein QMD65_02790 [Patescibacteria group bacterium]|nr:hypothetical protein [Patescibacteria group bacterium]
MGFETSNFEIRSSEDTARESTSEQEVGVEIVERERRKAAFEIKDLEEKITFLERAKKEISETAPLVPEALSQDHAPKDIDLYNLSKEERLRRREMITNRYKEALDKIPPIGKLLETDEKGLLVEQEIVPDNLVFIRADDYIPEINEKGELKILSAYDATDGKVWRLTNHFTLNHRVASNIGGSWENKSYQFIIPGEKIVETNGLPENLYSIDTFWAKSVELPQGTVIIYEHGKKPAIPEGREKDFILIERDKDVNDKELTSLVLERMNYSEIQGEAWSALPQYKEFDKGARSFAEKEHLRSGPHVYSWSDAFEEVGFAKSVLLYDHGLRNMLSLYREDYKEYARMPKELKEKAWQTIFESFTPEPRDYSKLRVERIELGGDPDNFTDEVISQNLKEAKVRTAKFLSDVLWGLYDEGKHQIPREDQTVMLKMVPKEAWQYQIDSMKEKIGTFEGCRDLEEMKGVFNKYFETPYKEITGKEINRAELTF